MGDGIRELTGTTSGSRGATVARATGGRLAAGRRVAGGRLGASVRPRPRPLGARPPRRETPSRDRRLQGWDSAAFLPCNLATACWQLSMLGRLWGAGTRSAGVALSCRARGCSS